MKYCVKCGTQLDDDAQFCTSCASPVPPVPPAQPQQPYNQSYSQPYGQQPYQQYPYQYPPQYGYPPYYDDAPSTGMTVLGFFLPLVGLILFLVWLDRKPQKAKSAGKGVLISVVAGMALYIFVMVFYVIASLVSYNVI